MKKRCIFLVGLMLSLCCVVSAFAQNAEQAAEQGPTTEELFQRAMGVYTIDRTAKTLTAAIGDLEQAVKIDPVHEASWELLCECYWQYGDMLPQKTKREKKVRRDWFAKGIAAGDKALAINPDNAGALFFKTTNMAADGDMKGWASSLWLYPTLRENMDRVENLQAHYLYGGTDRFYSEVLTRVPLWLAGKFGYTVEEIVDGLDKRIEETPAYFSNYLYAARLNWKIGEKEKALRYLRYVLTNDPAGMPEQLADNRMEQRVARDLWRQYTKEEWKDSQAEEK